MPVVGITSNNDGVSGTMFINFSATGFSVKSEQKTITDTKEAFRIFQLRWLLHFLIFLIMILIGTREVLCYFRMPSKTYGKNRLMAESLWRQSPRIIKGNPIITSFRVTPKILEFQDLLAIIYECREGLFHLILFNTSDSILATHSIRVNSYVLQSSILHNQIKFLRVPEEIRGFSLDIRIYPLPL